MHVRAERDDFYQSVIDYVIEKMWQIRSVALEQYREETNQLQKAQKIWLCDQHEELRMLEDDWLDIILKGITTFLFHGYEKILDKKSIKLGDAEYKHMQNIVTKNKEALR
jgi:CRISPR-associated protein Csy1